MRENLKDINHVRKRFNAVFSRYGVRTSFGHKKRTLLFLDVKDSYGNDVCDHIWFTDCKGWKSLKLKKGDKVSFLARVKPYWKGYVGDVESVQMDYKLSHPTSFAKFETKATNQNLLF